jgi:hypothetical protein
MGRGSIVVMGGGGNEDESIVAQGVTMRMGMLMRGVMRATDP